MAPISKFTSKLRSDSTAVRRTYDVVFPESIITFPLKDLLAIHGACSERTLPCPRVADDNGNWSLAEMREGEMEDKVLHHGACKQNRLVFTSTQEALMLDRDMTHEECARGASHDPGSHFGAVGHDLKERLPFDGAVPQEVRVAEDAREEEEVLRRLVGAWTSLEQRHPRASRIRSPMVPSPPSCEPERWMVTPRRKMNSVPNGCTHFLHSSMSRSLVGHCGWHQGPRGKRHR